VDHPVTVFFRWFVNISTAEVQFRLLRNSSAFYCGTTVPPVPEGTIIPVPFVFP
jgi:hypothetical protein